MLSRNTARSLLRDVQFPGDEDPTYPVAVSGKRKRRGILLEGGGGEEREIAAAVEIQRVWRGHHVRCKLQLILGRKQHNPKDGQKNVSVGRFPQVMAQYREYLRWCLAQGIAADSTAVLSFQDYSARIVQSWWRRLRGLRDGGRESSDRKGKKRKKEFNEQTAAVAIQRTWRRYNDVKVYRFYRDLISFRGRGDPALMLRGINPSEAKLLDKAVGAHVRFRLGGEKFPPNIYYKVFTRGPVVDLCACSPRDYTSMAHKRRLARDLHNKEPRSTKDDKDNWYKRWENNGWRLVSDRLFQSRFQDPVTVSTAAKKREFHHSKLQRREDEKKRKQRKVEWLKKMYRDGMLEARKDLSQSATSAVNIATETLMEATASRGCEAVEEGEEGEVDELLKWTNGLNYEEYVSDWYTAASSAFSDGTAVLPSTNDPHELTLQKT